MAFNTEREFEDALVALLSTEKGWEREIIVNPTEEQLIDNWASILFENNRGKDCLNNFPLTAGEMQQILTQVNTLKTPLALNGFINGKSVSIIRDNPLDATHFGKTVSLKIYDRHEIAAGQSRYQIVRQPKFPTAGITNDRRGDIMLLINGMPVFHLELKKSGVPALQGCNQIEKYSRAGIFTGLFALVQIFVAMSPDETLYFANPGKDGNFDRNYYFNWADFNNKKINNWKDIATDLISIPMAHELIGFYTVADSADGILKVMRSYQYYAARSISEKVKANKWERDNQLGGYIWHTTGSGKTMTSFKAAQLISQSGDADKVIFLVDRIELGTQSLKEYRSFASDDESVQGTEDGTVLWKRLKSDTADDTLIVTSIQKMFEVNDESGKKTKDLAKILKKRVVFVVDECHRSTFGDMLRGIKKTFPRAIFFGFTGTPIHDENNIKDNTTATVFGDELHRYSIADGIGDGNVLGFDPYMVPTFKEKDLREKIGLHEAKADTVAEAIADPRKAAIFYRFMNDVPMAGHLDGTGRYQRGIEDYLPHSQYWTDDHRNMVVEDVANNWVTLSRGSKFHAIFATASIPEAIIYYRLIKARLPELRVTALFDPNIDNENPEVAANKEAGLEEIMLDYNARFEQRFDFGSHAKFKKDIAARLAHKGVYKNIESTYPHLQLDLLIVVNQMLTGFDSKWINTLYMDKEMEYHDIIQAFSRTNRLFEKNEKPHGTIRYYRKPHTMHRNIGTALKLYSGDKPLALFADRLEANLNTINRIYRDIESLFANAGIADFAKLPSDMADCAMFAQWFGLLCDRIEAAKIQGFDWDKQTYEFKREQGTKTKVTLAFDYQTFLVLLQRYKELLGSGGGAGGGGDVPFDVRGYLTEISTGAIDAQYMNSSFEKYVKLLNQSGVTEAEREQALNELHKTFATLSQEEQTFANSFLFKVQSGDITLQSGKTLRDYITELQAQAKSDQISRFAVTFGVSDEKLRKFIESGVTEQNIGEYGHYNKLIDSVDKAKAKAYFEKVLGKTISIFESNAKMRSLLREFILNGGMDI